MSERKFNTSVLLMFGLMVFLGLISVIQYSIMHSSHIEQINETFIVKEVRTECTKERNFIDVLYFDGCNIHEITNTHVHDYDPTTPIRIFKTNCTKPYLRKYANMYKQNNIAIKLSDERYDLYVPDNISLNGTLCVASVY